MNCGTRPDGSHECTYPCDCGASWVWQRAPALDKRIENDDDFAGDAWEHVQTGNVHYVSVGVTPEWVEEHQGPDIKFFVAGRMVNGNIALAVDDRRRFHVWPEHDPGGKGAFQMFHSFSSFLNLYEVTPSGRFLMLSIRGKAVERQNDPASVQMDESMVAEVGKIIFEAEKKRLQCLDQATSTHGT